MKRHIAIFGSVFFSLIATISIGNLMWLGFLLITDHQRYGQINVPFDPIITSLFSSAIWLFLTAGFWRRAAK